MSTATINDKRMSFIWKAKVYEKYCKYTKLLMTMAKVFEYKTVIQNPTLLLQLNRTFPVNN